MNKEEISEIFCNSNNMYYGHGTSSADNMESIFSTGLRCSRRAETIYFTTIEMGKGNENLFLEHKEILDNWPHQNCENIIIISVPAKYQNILPDGMIGQVALIDLKYKPNKTGYLKPEFIKGMYNAKDGSFIDNPKYYENLPQEDQDKLFAEVKQNYIDKVKNQLLRTGSTFEKYSKGAELRGLGTPLTDEEIKQLDMEMPKEDELVAGILFEDIDELTKTNATISGINEETKIIKGTKDKEEINLEDMEWD